MRGPPDVMRQSRQALAASIKLSYRFAV